MPEAAAESHRLTARQPVARQRMVVAGVVRAPAVVAEERRRIKEAEAEHGVAGQWEEVRWEAVPSAHWMAAVVAVAHWRLEAAAAARQMEAAVVAGRSLL